MRRKQSPITEVESLDYPRLGWVADQSDAYGRGPLHIADKRCKQNGQFKSLTRCGRPIDFVHYFHDGITKVPTDSVETFRLCHRCGSESEFATALTAHNAGHATWLKEYKARRAAEDAEREAATERYRERIARLRQAMNFPLIEDWQYAITFEFEGYKYAISERGEVKSAEDSER